MAFKVTKKENSSFSKPQEMYKDYKNRTIKGPLDYQSDMIDLYMKYAYNPNKKNVALELPTGSGKTFVGLLLGEFRRRKNKEKVLYLCSTTQLVNQVAEQANNKYGIKVNSFTGKFKDHNPQAKTEYMRCEKIAISNYSTFFNNYTPFKDPDIIIFDDVHSSEEYIAANWTLDISREDNLNLYKVLIENIKDMIEIDQYNKMMNDDPLPEDKQWFDKVPNIKWYKRITEVISIIDENVKGTNLKYSWVNIKNHLHACNMFFSWDQILIRPIIAPTMTFDPLASAKQRIFMSATLGNSGELERITGISDIYRLPIINDWDKKGLGRRFFMFPDVSFSTKDILSELLLKINSMVNRTVILVPDNNHVIKLRKILEDNTDAEIFTGKDIEISKQAFVESPNAVALLANRFDGIDFSDDECRMLIVMDLPKATNLQENFLVTRMAASVLFNERIKTRIVQAIGRCTRGQVDYSAVCIMGNYAMNELISPKKQSRYHVELQAEIDFGYTQSKDHSNIDDFLENLKLFLARGKEWDVAEEDIISKRDAKIIETSTNRNKANMDVVFNKLKDSAKYEVLFQYEIWKQDYEKAFEYVENIVGNLDAPILRGYKGFWYYIGGYVANQLYIEGNKPYIDVSKKYFKAASTCTTSITWFNKLISNKENNEKVEGNLFSDTIERIEKQMMNYGTRNNNKFEAKVKDILELLHSNDGNKFERGHKELGTLIGYSSDNTSGEADPDPWWIVNNDLCIVSEDKIYKSENSIPVKHVRQAAGHVNWIREKITQLSSDATIITVMITNSDTIEKAAVIHAKDIWYVNRNEFCVWGLEAIEAIRILRRNFIEEGNLEWREAAEKTFIERKVTPSDFLKFITRKRLSEIKNL